MLNARFFLTHENMNAEIPFKIFKNKGPFRQPPHSHEYLQMWYVRAGHCTHYLNGHFYEYARFGLFIIPPYAPHYIVVEEEQAELICCEFSERFINEALMNENRSGLFDFAYLEPFFLSENLIQTTYRVSAESAPQIERLFVDLLYEFEHQRKYSPLFIKANLLKLLAVIASEYEHRISEEQNELLSHYHDAIDRALSYLEEHYAEKLYLEDVCRISLMSHSTFSYIFKQVTGQTFSEYIMNLRLTNACKLLRESDLSILEICTRCGFSDSNYFSRAFKKQFGIPPSYYRRELRATLDNNADDKDDN